MRKNRAPDSEEFTMFDIRGLKEHPEVGLVLKLQTDLHSLNKTNVEKVASSINELGFLNNNIRIFTLLRNIMRLFEIRPHKGNILRKLLQLLIDKYGHREEIVDNIRRHMFYCFLNEGELFLYACVELNILTIDEVLEERSKEYFQDFELSEEAKKGINKNEVAIAIRQDSEKLLEHYLTKGKYDINYRIPNDNNGELNDLLKFKPTIVQYACFYGSINCFRLLVKKKANLNLNTKNLFNKEQSFSITTYASAGGNMEIIKHLVQKALVFKTVDLEFAIMFHRIEVFKWIIEKNPEFLDQEIFEICVKHEFLPGIMLYDEAYLEMTLISACGSNNFDIAQHILQIPGVDANKRVDNNYRSPLNEACENASLEVVELLKSVPGIDPNFASESSSGSSIPLVESCCMGITEIVKILLTFPGIDPNLGNESFGRFTFPLFEACLYGRSDIVKLLLSFSGIDVNQEAMDDYPTNSLFVAVKEGFYDIVDMLLNHPGIKVNRKAFYAIRRMEAEDQIVRESYPLHEAVKRGFTDIVERLLEFPGIKINMLTDVDSLIVDDEEDVEHSFPLLEACRRGHTQMVRMLLERPEIDVNLIVMRVFLIFLGKIQQ